ncbi:hypothetical protein RchiOBHm_Chr7g0240891 [Rosa chinensis]|uniref:Uncharacterized protein n=1 Tax=Rosa chinensis TaxID=74649 RepID=A0A2P6PI41_ROSCH|nr:hypothetical protein RchiOBHm_Chr7g0240891 [Rosa chinensis]
MKRKITKPEEAYSFSFAVVKRFTNLVHNVNLPLLCSNLNLLNNVFYFNKA